MDSRGPKEDPLFFKAAPPHDQDRGLSNDVAVLMKQQQKDEDTNSSEASLLNSHRRSHSHNVHSSKYKKQIEKKNVGRTIVMKSRMQNYNGFPAPFEEIPTGSRSNSKQKYSISNSKRETTPLKNLTKQQSSKNS